jgi:hypothetical protein
MTEGDVAVGDTPCWMERVCPDCGRLLEAPVEEAGCPRCHPPESGAPPPADVARREPPAP